MNIFGAKWSMFCSPHPDGILSSTSIPATLGAMKSPMNTWVDHIGIIASEWVITHWLDIVCIRLQMTSIYIDIELSVVNWYNIFRHNIHVITCTDQGYDTYIECVAKCAIPCYASYFKQPRLTISKHCSQWHGSWFKCIILTSYSDAGSMVWWSVRLYITRLCVR
jgi:hypothetical protein